MRTGRCGNELLAVPNVSNLAGFAQHLKDIDRRQSGSLPRSTWRQPKQVFSSVIFALRARVLHIAGKQRQARVKGVPKHG